MSVCYKTAEPWLANSADTYSEVSCSEMCALEWLYWQNAGKRKCDKTCFAKNAHVSHLGPVWTKATEVVQVCQSFGEMPQCPVSFHSVQP